MLFPCLCYSQRTSFLGGYEKLEIIKNYFNENQDYLDEIEGVYDVSYIPYFSGGNQYTGIRHWGGNELSVTATIVRTYEGDYACKFHFEKDYGDIPTGMDIWGWGHNIWHFIKLGNSNVYRMNGKYSEKYKHFGNSGTLKFDISSRVTLNNDIITVSFNGNDGFHRVEGNLSFFKIYPLH